MRLMIIRDLGAVVGGILGIGAVVLIPIHAGPIISGAIGCCSAITGYVAANLLTWGQHYYY